MQYSNRGFGGGRGKSEKRGNGIKRDIGSVNGSKNGKREDGVKEAENKKGILEKARRGENFSEKILWIEKLSLCLQCLNKWRLSSEKS